MRSVKLFITIATSTCQLMSLVSCSALDFGKPNTNENSKPYNLVNDQLTLNPVGTDEPNDIRVQIHIPKSFKPNSILRRTQLNTNTKELIDIAGGDDFSDGNLVAGETYLYEVGSISGGSFLVLASSKVTVPRDLVVRGVVNLNGANNADFVPFRIFFRNHGLLVTNGQSMTLTTTEIISDNGTISSFDPSIPAPMSVRGRSGGVLRIKAHQLKGHLNIVMRGETGGVGAPGMPGAEGSGSGDTSPTDGTAGGVGAPGGNSGMVHVAIDQYQASDLSISALPGLGGAGGQGGNNGEGHGGGYAPNGPRGYDGQVDPQQEDWK